MVFQTIYRPEVHEFMVFEAETKNQQFLVPLFTLG